ncbi:MAG: flippase-like domain-containing protein [Candidatus Undinarchaeales archaeon]
MHKKSLILAISGIVVFFLLFRFIGTTEIIAVLLKSNLKLIGAAVALQIVLWLVWTYRWKLVMNHLNLKISFPRLFNYLLLVNFGDVITPGPRFGAEPLVSYYMEKKEKIAEKDSLTTMLVERLYGILAFIFLAEISIFVLINLVSLNLWILVLIGVSFFIATSIGLFTIDSMFERKYVLRLINKITKKFLPFIYHLRKKKHGKLIETFKEYKSRVVKNINLFFDEALYLSKDKKLWFFGTALSFLFYFIVYLQVYLVFMAVGAPISIYLAMVLITLSELVGFLVMLPSGVGVTEILIIAIATAAGIPIASAVAATLIVRAIFYISGISSGYASMLYLGSSVKK